jgi:hypothetical protein
VHVGEQRVRLADRRVEGDRALEVAHALVEHRRVAAGDVARHLDDAEPGVGERVVGVEGDGGAEVLGAVLALCRPNCR